MIDPSTSEPPRLLDDPTVSDVLRRDLQIAQGHAPLAYPVEAGLARFEQTISAGAMAAPSSVLRLRLLGWFAGAITLLGGAAWLLLGQGAPTELRSEEQAVPEATSSDASEGPRDPGASLTPVVTTGAQVPLESPAEAGPAEASPAEAGPADLRPTSKTTTKPTTEPTPTATPKRPITPAPGDELALINAARKALPGDPAKALALMQDAEQRFPSSAMVQERRGYIILALTALGRRAEAQTQAGAYLERWPNGPLSPRIRKALGLD